MDKSGPAFCYVLIRDKRWRTAASGYYVIPFVDSSLPYCLSAWKSAEPFLYSPIWWTFQMGHWIRSNIPNGSYFQLRGLFNINFQLHLLRDNGAIAHIFPAYKIWTWFIMLSNEFVHNFRREKFTLVKINIYCF